MLIELSDEAIAFIDQAHLAGTEICDFEDCALGPVIAAIDAARPKRITRFAGPPVPDRPDHTSAGYASTPSSAASVITHHDDCSACHFFRTIPALKHTCGVW